MKLVIKSQFEPLFSYLIGEHLNIINRLQWFPNLMDVANVVFGSLCMDVENDAVTYYNTSHDSLAKAGTASC